MSSIITWHPTYAFFWNPYEAGTFVEDVKRFGRLVRGELRPPPMKLLRQPKLEALKRICTAQNFVAVDIETGPQEPQAPWTGKDPTRATLRTIGFGYEEEGCSVEWATASPAVRNYVAQVLDDSRVMKVFHNGPWFDLRVLTRYRLRVRNYLDTRDMRRAVSTTSQLSLRYLASLYDDTNNWKAGDDDAGAKGIVFTDKMKKLQRYNAQDCVETARVFVAICKEDKWKTSRVQKIHDVHRRVSTIAAKMHTAGMYVNKQWWGFMTHCVRQTVEEQKLNLQRAVGEKDFRCTDHAMRSLIYKRHAKQGRKSFNLPDPLNAKMYTNDALQKISVDEPSLLLLLISGECPPELVDIIDVWWEVQAAKKRLGYLESNLLGEAIGRDGKLRPGWNSCGTDTMRFSCNQPNVMNIEQDLRHMFGPAPGRVWVHADKSQQELRIMAAVAQDTVLEKALQTGDVYAFNALEWFGQLMEKGTTVADIKKKYPGQRKASKITHLGRQYAAGIATCFSQALKQDRHFTFSRTRELIRMWDSTYYRTVQYWSDEQARVMSQGYSEGRLLFGRRYYPRPPDLSEIANFPIQRTAGEMMMLELIELDKQLTKRVPDARIVVQLHDAFDVDADERDEELVCQIMSEVMDREYTIEGKAHPFPVEIKVAHHMDTWAAV